MKPAQENNQRPSSERGYRMNNRHSAKYKISMKSSLAKSRRRQKIGIAQFGAWLVLNQARAISRVNNRESRLRISGERGSPAIIARESPERNNWHAAFYTGKPKRVFHETYNNRHGAKVAAAAPFLARIKLWYAGVRLREASLHIIAVANAGACEI